MISDMLFTVNNMLTTAYGKYAKLLYEHAGKVNEPWKNGLNI